jgi:hypothetical protein
MGAEHLDNMKPTRLLIASLLTAFVLQGFSFPLVAQSASVSQKWKITTIRVCRDRNGYLNPHFEALGNYPVYSFFIPRPVWTVNGTVVEAQPIYDRGSILSFRLLRATPLLKSRQRNTIKFSLPDQTGVKIFYFDQSKAPPADCFEFF